MTPAMLIDFSCSLCHNCSFMVAGKQLITGWPSVETYLLMFINLKTFEPLVGKITNSLKKDSCWLALQSQSGGKSQNEQQQGAGTAVLFWADNWAAAINISAVRPPYEFNLLLHAFLQIEVKFHSTVHGPESRNWTGVDRISFHVIVWLN